MNILDKLNKILNLVGNCEHSHDCDLFRYADPIYVNCTCGKEKALDEIHELIHEVERKVYQEDNA